MIFVWAILAVLSLAVIAVIVARHFAELRILNIETLPRERERRVRSVILAGRLARFGQKQAVYLRRTVAPLRTFGSRIATGLDKRIHDLEVAYLAAKRKTLRTRGRRTAQIVGLLREADELRDRGELEEAERKYVSVVALDPKNVDAYENLGNLYLEMKKYPEAREALQFLLKFRPNDASVRTSMGEVALAEEKLDEAVGHFRRAVDLRPGNPKYLDFLIEAAIRAKDKSAAEHGLKLIKEANPENNKITEWESRVAAL